jgi:hypothetical protein
MTPPLAALDNGHAASFHLRAQMASERRITETPSCAAKIQTEALPAVACDDNGLASFERIRYEPTREAAMAAFAKSWRGE